MFSVQKSRQSGASLIVVLLILVVVTILGVGGAQIALMGERAARNDRDYQIAWQSAEAALLDAEFDIQGPNAAANNRMALFATGNNQAFVVDCGTPGNDNRGLCETATTATKPVWLTVNLEATDTATQATLVGTFTGRDFNVQTGGGLGPARTPRYVVEILRDREIFSDIGTNNAPPDNYLYRVTAMGFGPRPDIQGVVQMLFRKIPEQ